MTPERDEELLREEEAAAEIKTSPSTMQKWRMYRKGPPFVKVGRGVRYRRGDLRKWLASSTVQTAA